MNIAKTVTVVYSREADSQATMLAHSLNDVGVAVDLIEGQTHRGEQEILLAIILAIPLKAFLDALGASLGSAAGSAVKRLVDNVIRMNPKSRNQKIVLRDLDHIEIELTCDLPDQAYDLLAEIEIAYAVRLRYEQIEGKWHELDT